MAIVPFPMLDGAGRVVGFHTRSPEGEKRSIPGSNLGLFIPKTFARGESVMICEGPTDTAAALDMGFNAIGRPSCRACVTLTKNFLPFYDAVIVADNDCHGAGLRGATELAKVLNRPPAKIKIVSPPGKIKDLRDWVSAGLTCRELIGIIEMTPEL